MPISDSLPIYEKYRELNTSRVAELKGISRAELWRRVKDGRLPKPKYKKPHCPTWYLGEILDHDEHLAQNYEAQQRGRKGSVNPIPEKSASFSSTAKRIRERLKLL